jgi:K319L-like, PKD domain
MKVFSMAVERGCQSALILLIFLPLISCGGGNSPPIADAGVDQNQRRGAKISLDGRNSIDPDGDLLTYSWTLTSFPAGSMAVLSDASSPTPSFMADTLGEYVISLVVSDGDTLSTADEVTVVVNTGLIYVNNFSQNTLSDFLVGEEGSAQISIDQNQLRIDPGEGYLNRGYVALDLPKYSAGSIGNPSKIVWAFNVSNIDGTTCGACNNKFGFYLFSDPDPYAPEAFGYALEGGGVGWSKMYFRQQTNLSSFGSFLNTIFEVDDGLENLPTIGTFKLTYETNTGLWELYYEESLTPFDPKKISTLVGSGINTEFALDKLPYLILFSENTSSSFFDNLSVMFEFSI